MSTTSPIKNWSHPFKPKEGDIDPLKALTAMSKAGSGFYPIGKNGQWHGGIHFDANTAHVFDQSSVRCIADGEVIAYRIDSSYPLSRYLDERDRPRNAPFSTGFVLVKHRLEAPALPASEEPPPSLTFYSLYMHLLDWSGYSKPGAPTPPVFISETLYQVKPDKATDTLVGLRVRSVPGGTVLAILPKGCKVKAGEVDTADPKWRKLVSILQGRTLPAISGPDLGWVYTGEMQPMSEPDQFLVGELANDPEPGLATEKGLNVRKAGNGRRNDPKTGLLPLGTTFSLEPGTGAYRKLKAIIEGQDIAPLSTNSVNNIQGYVHFESLQATRAVPELDKVQLLAAPYPIKAGDLIGHLGLYQNHDDASPQQMLHLEVFSCEDVPRFIAKSRAWAARLPAEQKSLLKVYKGASKLIRHHEAINASNPPRLSDAGTVVGVDLIIPQILLDKLPADRKLQVSTPVPGSSTPRVTNWWRLDNLLADASGNSISGWLAEQEPITTRHSPWEWVGYDFIQETGRPIRKAAYFFEALRRLTDQELANYRALVSQEDQGPVRSRLYDIIDSNRDNNLTPYEIQTALKHPWHAQSITQLITRYESEWLLNKEKWDELDPLMGHVPIVDPNHNWVSEKQRIEKLNWWGTLAGKQGISTNGMAWHFQPINMADYFKKHKRHPIIKIHGEDTELEFLEMFQGGEVKDEDIRSAAAELRCEPGLVYAIARQESAHSSFINIDGEKIPSILYERHQFRRYSGNPAFAESHPEIYGAAYKRARQNRSGAYIEVKTGTEISLQDIYGPSGKFQYERLMAAYRLNEDAALKSCSWGKFQIMGFNHEAAGFRTVKEFTAAMSTGDAEHIKAFLKFARSNSTLLNGLREKNFEKIAEGHNGSDWRGINPDYATNIERFYNEYNAS